MQHKVMIMRCDEYDPRKIKQIIIDCMLELGVRPHGKVLLKPNCVMAHPQLFPYAYTRPEFVEGVMAAVRTAGKDLERVALGERSGITIPTRYCFSNAGYPEIAKKYEVEISYFDETKHVPVNLKSGSRLRDIIYLPECYTDTDFFVNLPKFKAHPWTRLTLSLKNLIGIQDDRHRLVDHNAYLEHKIADLAETLPNGLIAIDAITAGQKMMLTPTPFHMGAIVVGTNACAVDTVGCHVVNVEPQQLLHLKYAHERGLGPINIGEIEIGGDYPLQELQTKTAHFEFCMEHIDSYFNLGNLSCTVGSFPESHSPDYCWGGCPGALQEAMHIFEMYYPGTRSNMRKIKYVVGKVEGPINLEQDERVLFMGDCTSWEGEIDGEHVVIKSNYCSKNESDVHNTPSNDMILKIVGSLWDCLTNGSKRYLHAQGCPVSVAAHINYLSFLGSIKNVNFDTRTILPVNLQYLNMRMHRAINRFSS